MENGIVSLIVLSLLVLLLAAQALPAATEDLGNGFAHHGVATPISNHRGTVATQDGEGRDVVLLWLYDSRGGYALLMIDAETGQAEQIPMPFPPGGDGPYASVLSSRNRFYTHFNSHFCEFDPVQRKFTFFAKTAPQMAMGMTEDDNGVIWSVTYPQSGVCSYDPATGEFKDYGHLYTQTWAQYQRDVACDDQGWLYLGIGSTRGQIIAFDPKTATATPIIPEEERIQGTGYVYRDQDGKVYGHGGNQEKWLELYGGQATPIAVPENRNPKPIITSSQGLFHRQFPSGRRLIAVDLVNRELTTEAPEGGQRQTVPFEYTSEGAHIMGVCAAPNGTICGGTAFPMRYFGFNPQTDTWDNRPGLVQWNTTTVQGDRFFIGGYGGGVLLEWDPAKPWVDTVKGNPDCNPVYLTDSAPDINRPFELYAHPDGKTIILAGGPGYGYTGGGMLFWDRETKQQVLLKHTDLLENHAINSMVAIPDGKLLCGSTTAPGTGGQKIATEAELFILDMATKQVEWREVVFPGAQGYNDLCMAPSGLVYGVTDSRRFFVFDPVQRKVVHEVDASAELGATSNQQGPRIFAQTDNGSVYMVFQRGMVKVNPETYALTMVAESPIACSIGGDYLDGRIYFGHGSHVYSWQVPEGD